MNFDLQFYWKLFVRRLPVMMLFVLVCSGLGLITAYKLPDVWSTSARLLLEEAQIPENMVSSTVQTEGEEQLDLIQQKLMTRANLVDIANRFNVFEDIRRMEPDLVVERMREATDLRRSAGRNKATVMTLSFEARTPEIAANVVNEYVTLVLQENAQFRMSRAENTLQFFNQEVERLGQDLDRQSSAIALFKTENAEALPEDQSYRLNRLNLLQERIAALEREINAARGQRDDIQRRFDATGRVQQSGEATARRTPEEQQLIEERARLESYKSTFSDTNPRVVRQQVVVDRLEALVAGQGPQDADVKEAVSAETAILNTTLAQIDTRLGFLISEQTSAQKVLEELQGAISRSSANGIQLAALERDYENTQTRYNAAVRNLNEARMSERIETTAQGQRITVIENANVPQVPTGPNRLKIAVAGVAAGIGLAGLYFAALEFLNRSIIRTPRELANRFNITPIATIPYMESRRRRLVRRGGIVAATLLVVLGVPAALWFIDTNFMPLELFVQRGLAKLGLG